MNIEFPAKSVILLCPCCLHIILNEDYLCDIVQYICVDAVVSSSNPDSLVLSNDILQVIGIKHLCFSHSIEEYLSLLGDDTDGESCSSDSSSESSLDESIDNSSDESDNDDDCQR